MSFGSRALYSIASAFLICALSLYFVEGCGQYLLLPGYFALGARYVFGGPVLAIAIPLDWLLYLLLTFGVLTLLSWRNHKMEAK